jgi:16S rRNA pseudouridine516 synthase
MKGTERLDKILSNLGYGTRSEVRKIIKDKRVTIDGNIVKDPSMHVMPFNSLIAIDGEKIEYSENQYIMLNKPSGYVSATYDPRESTVLELLDERYQKIELFPIGRLDKDTEGLLIMTDDGKLAHELLSPKKHVNKVYYAEILGAVGDDDKQKFSEGIVLDDGYKTMPAGLEIMYSGEISKVHVTIKEGKYHQVKRMFEAVDKKVQYLKRIKMGNLDLDNNLECGEYRKLTEEELKVLKNFS